MLLKNRLFFFDDMREEKDMGKLETDATLNIN